MTDKPEETRQAPTPPKKVRLKQRIRKLKIMSRHPYAVPVITTIVLLVVIVGVYGGFRLKHKLPPVQDAKIVIISHDHQQQIVPSKEATVGSLLKKLNITLHQGDVVEPAQTTMIKQDQFRINVYRAVPVQIVDGDQKTFTFSAAKTPRAIAQQVGTSLYPEDITVRKPVDNFLSTGAIGEQVVVDRATPVEVDLYGTPVTLRTHAKTVAGLVKEKGIKLEPKDQIMPATNTPISSNQKITFLRTGTKVETITEDIPTPIQTINDPSLAYGTKAIRQTGSPGQQVVTYQVQIVNNVEKGRTAIQKVVNKQAVTQVEVVGTSLSGIKGDMALAGISAADYAAADFIISHESGWRPNAANASGAYGLCQAMPGSKMASAGADWATNPITQLKWCTGYANSRYGGWSNAYSHWLATRNW